MRELRRSFVLTVSALSVASCGESTTPAPTAPTATAPTATAPTATAPAASTSAPRAKPTATSTPPADPSPRLSDYPHGENALDAQGRSIFRASGDQCYVELPWPAGKPRMPGEAPPQQQVACPPEMKAAAWETCRGGAILAKIDRSACVCFTMGNPPPPPVPNACPDTARPAAAPATLGLRATTAMKMSGTIDADKLVAEANRQIAAVSRCAPLVRKTDSVVGSLNLQVTVARDGKVTPDLQSPVNDEAKRCILDAVRAWSVKGAGAGQAMVLLTLE